MPQFDPNQFTEGQAVDASILVASMTASDSGTPGLYLRAATERGEIEGTIWLTPNTRDRAQRTLNDLGVTDEQLASDEFWDEPASVLVGIECSVVPEINTYEGKDSWRVKWWNRRRKVVPPETKQRAAGLFRMATAPTLEADAAALMSGKDPVPF